MKTDGWRERLQYALDSQKRSMRAVSIEAGCGEAYLSGILNEGKDPSIERLVRVCNVLNVSLGAILFGIEETPGQQEFLRLLQYAPDPVRKSILDILRATATQKTEMQSAEDPQP